MVKNYNLFLESNQHCEYVLGIPSGEVIYADKITLNKMISDNIVYFNHIIDREIIRCLCFEDKDRDKIMNYIDNSKIKNTDTSDEIIIKICEEYQKKIGTIIGKRIAIGYYDYYGCTYLYAIIPDLIMNKKFYAIKESEIEKLLKDMHDIYPNCFFYYNNRITDNKIKYYM